MSAIQDLATNIENFPGRVRQAKDDNHYTIDELADLSGVGYSAVARLTSGAQADPKLYNSAALCKVLGLSLDELFSLSPPSGTDAALIERAHQAEVDAATARGESDALRESISGTRAYARRQTNATVLLAVLCTVLALVVLGYMVFDHSQLNAGLIRNGEFTAFAWALAALLGASVIAAVRALWRAFRPRS